MVENQLLKNEGTIINNIRMSITDSGALNHFQFTAEIVLCPFLHGDKCIYPFNKMIGILKCLYVSYLSPKRLA